ncbi:MAG: 30S ribosomal protein S16 [Thermoanaerobaculia bacterium]|nr:30S ribosomal protein S16 [Thermoanaerobaculia bacterium]
MSVKLRLQRKGRKKAPFYHIVAADARSPRDGRFIEKLGTYNPLTVPATIELNREKAYEWLMKGAQPTDTVNAILRFKGILYQKHLALGVKKGALTEEQANAKLNAWLEEKESRIAKRREATAEKKRQHVAAVDGMPKAKAKAAPVAEPVAPVEVATEEPAVAAGEPVRAAEETAPVVEETAPVVAETATVVAEEAAPVAEAVAPEAPAEATAPAEQESAPAAEPEAPATEEKTEE